MKYSDKVRQIRGVMNRDDFGDIIGFSGKQVEAIELERSLGSPDFAVSVAKRMDKPEILDFFCELNCPIGHLKNCGGCANAQKNTATGKVAA